MPRGYQPFGLPAFPSPLKEEVPCRVFYGLDLRFDFIDGRIIDQQTEVNGMCFSRLFLVSWQVSGFPLL